MKCKSNVCLCFKLSKSFFKKDGKHTILALCTENGGEYMSKVF
jgi:hypothetical protein